MYPWNYQSRYLSEPSYFIHFNMRHCLYNYLYHKVEMFFLLFTLKNSNFRKFCWVIRTQPISVLKLFLLYHTNCFGLLLGLLSSFQFYEKFDDLSKRQNILTLNFRFQGYSFLCNLNGSYGLNNHSYYDILYFLK